MSALSSRQQREMMHGSVFATRSDRALPERSKGRWQHLVRSRIWDGARRGYTPHASGSGCETPAISDSGSAREDVQWTFLNVLFSNKRLIGTFVQSLVENRRKRCSVLGTQTVLKVFFPPPRSEACLTTSVLALLLSTLLSVSMVPSSCPSLLMHGMS